MSGGGGLGEIGVVDMFDIMDGVLPFMEEQWK